MKLFTTKIHLGRSIALCTLFIFSIILLAACGSGSSTSDEATSNTGSIAFSVVWASAASQNAEPFDCENRNVSRVIAQVLDEDNQIIAEDLKGWPCSSHTGTITGVDVGENRKVVVSGMDSNGNVMYEGESLRKSIMAGDNNFGTIDLIPVNVYTIEAATIGTGGTIYPSGDVTVDNGMEQTFTITPDYGYNVAEVEVDDSSKGAITTYTFPDVDNDHTIEATFVAIWLVDGDVISSGDGKTWATAFKTIQEAIDAAQEEGLTEIWVKQGTYVIASMIEVSKPVKIYAGFAGTEFQMDQRDWQDNETTVDGAGVIKCFYVSVDAVIDGFTITGANGESGIYNGSDSAFITNCTFSGNSVSSGGGIYNSWSSSTITNCTFVGNSASSGGGIYNESSSPYIANCIFSGNSASNGSGIYNSNSSANIINCTFSGNSASGNGGAISNSGISSASIINCILWGDTATTGSEIYNDSNSDATVTYCDIDQDEYAGSDGNIRQDPLFGADLHLQAESPCLDTGNLASAPSYDIDGEARPEPGGTNVDMGADEFYDSDGDKMPDYWEMKYDLDPSADDSSLNPDGDGLTNLEEYQDGTSPIDASPTANITNPSDGSLHHKDDYIEFKGTGSDPEDGVLTGNSLVWTSNFDGKIGTGTEFSSTSLSLGIHTITLTATDTQGATGSHEISITIYHH